MVGPAVTVEHRAPDFVAATPAAERAIDQPPRLAAQVLVELQGRGWTAHEVVAALADQGFAGFVDEEQVIGGIEREHRHANLFHHMGQERRRLDRLGALPLQRGPEVVDLAHHHRDRASAPRRQPANRVVPFAQRAQQVGDEIQRPHRELARHRRRNPPRANDDDGQRPADFRSVGLMPDVVHRHDDGGQAAAEHKPHQRELEIASPRRPTPC